MRLFAPPERNFDGLEKAIGPGIGATPGQMAPALATNFWGWLREPFAGAWQKNITVEQPQNLLAFGAVYACTTLLCDDVGKLQPKLQEQMSDGTWKDVIRNSPFLPVLTKPNQYQNRIQFYQQWIASKLLHGNAYILLDRGANKMVQAMYVLNPFYVVPLVAVDGSVYYQINTNWLAGVAKGITVPASEVIHDRCTAIWHPLVGVSPIYACGASATQGIRIQSNSAHFFENMSRPSGQLTAPGTISDETAARLKKEFETNFSHGNIGRLLITGDGLKYEGMAIPAADAQLIQQLGWTVEDVARSYKVPMYKIGGPLPTGGNMASLNQDYYNQALHIHIEGIELGLKEGLGLPDASTPNEYCVRFDLDGLLRMDPLARSDMYSKMITSAVLAPNEARKKENYSPVEGGDTPYLQQQNFSLAALAKRDEQPAPSSAAPGPFSPPPPKPTEEPPPEPAPPTPPAKAQVIEGEFTVEKDIADELEFLFRTAPLLELAETA